MTTFLLKLCGLDFLRRRTTPKKPLHRKSPNPSNQHPQKEHHFKQNVGKLLGSGRNELWKQESTKLKLDVFRG